MSLVPDLPAWEPSRDFTIYDKSTGAIVMAGHNKPSCVERDCKPGQGVIYAHSTPVTHYVDMSAGLPLLRLKPEYGG